MQGGHLPNLQDGRLPNLKAPVNDGYHSASISVEDITTTDKAHRAVAVTDVAAAPLLEIKNLQACYEADSNSVLHDVSLTVHRGEWVGLGWSQRGWQEHFVSLLTGLAAHFKR